MPGTKNKRKQRKQHKTNRKKQQRTTLAGQTIWSVKTLHCQREWETESVEQKSAEDKRVRLRETTCRQRKERSCNKRTSLRSQHCLVCWGQRHMFERCWISRLRAANFCHPSWLGETGGGLNPFRRFPIRGTKRSSLEHSSATNHSSDGWDLQSAHNGRRNGWVTVLDLNHQTTKPLSLLGLTSRPSTDTQNLHTIQHPCGTILEPVPSFRQHLIDGRHLVASPRRPSHTQQR